LVNVFSGWFILWVGGATWEAIKEKRKENNQFSLIDKDRLVLFFTGK
jgi:hypothetical protein